MEAALNAKFHKFFKITLVLPFIGDGIDIKHLLQRWYFDQIKGQIPRYGAMVVSVIWKVNRGIQTIMYNYKRWCPDIDSADFKCTCNILTEEFKLTPSKTFGHVRSPI